jgi:hypothetical protein
VTLRLALIVTTHGPVPVHDPLQPVKVEPVAGVAESVTDVPDANCAVQVWPQSIPAGLETTVPVPVPLRVTVRAWGVGMAVKVAVTLRLAVIATTHEPVPAQAPLQPPKVEPAAGVAESMTEVPDANCAEQVEPQSIPGGLDDTRPDPVPVRETESG